MTPLRFGVVGTAYWAREVHLPGLLATPGAQVMGVWGRTPATVREIAERHGVAAFGSFEAMLDEVDAVTMAVPPEVQAEFAPLAAKAGKHLILEKPIARDPAAARAVAGAVREAGVASLVFFLRRFQPEIAAALAAAEPHRWTQAEVRVHSAALSTASPYAGSAWRREAGAALWDIGPHALSVLIPLLGDVVAVEGRAETDGITRFRTEHARGGTAEVSVTLRSPPDQTSNHYRLQSPTRDLVLPDPAFDRTEVFALAARQLVAMAEAGRTEDPCDVALGAGIVDVLATVERSAREGARVTVTAADEATASGDVVQSRAP